MARAKRGVRDSLPRRRAFRARGLTKVYHMGEVEVHALRHVALLLGEQAAITLLAIPMRWVLRIGIGVAVLAQFEQERYRIPMVITEQTYIYSALIAIVSAVLAGMAVRRRIYRLDLIEVLRTPQ